MPEQQTVGPLHVYLTRVLSDQDRVLFEEAARTAQVSALRAAYVMTWLSCAESLKRKFKEMAIRDATARKVSSEIEQREATHRAVDTYILKEAEKYGLITAAEYTQLDQIHTMRCIYAHPYEQQPTVEQLVAAACTVIDIVLGRPTRLRQGYLEEQVRLLTEEPTFLDDLRAAVEGYAEQVQAKADGNLHLWFLRKLWGRLEDLAREPSMGIFLRRGIWFSIAYLRRIPEDLIKWDMVADLPRFSAVLSQILAEDHLFVLLGNHARDIVVGNLLANSATDRKYIALVGQLNSAGVLNERHLERVTSAVLGMPLAYLVAADIHPSCYVGRIIEELKSHNWYRQNPAIDAVQNIGSQRMGQLPTAVQRLLGNNVLQAAEGDSNRAREFLRDMVSTDWEAWPEHFVEGVLSECFINDKDEIRFKTECLSEASRGIVKLAEESRVGLVGRLVSRIQKGQWKGQEGWPHREGKQKAVRIILDTIEVDQTQLGVLKRLVEVVAGLETEQYETF